MVLAKLRLAATGGIVSVGFGEGEAVQHIRRAQPEDDVFGDDRPRGGSVSARPTGPQVLRLRLTQDARQTPLRMTTQSMKL